MWVHVNVLFWRVPTSKVVVVEEVRSRFERLVWGANVEEAAVAVHPVDLDIGCSCSPRGPCEDRQMRLGVASWHVSIVFRMREESMAMWNAALSAYESIVQFISALGCGAHATAHSTPPAGCVCNLRNMQTVMAARDWSERRLNEVAASEKA